MSPIRIRPRSAIADADLARVATVDLPHISATARRLRAPGVMAKAIASLGRPMQPERVILLTLSPVAARRR